MSKEEQYYEIGDWFFALDGCIYEYVGGDVGSKKICTMIDIKQSAFITDNMKKNANIIKMSNKMYGLLKDLSELMQFLDSKTHSSIELDGVKYDIDKLLAQARGE